MTSALIPVKPTTPTPIADALEAALYGLKPHTIRAYQRHLTRFLAWLPAQPDPGLTRFTVERYLTHKKLSPAAHNQALSALKRLAFQAASHGWLDWTLHSQIDSLPSARQRGVRSGVWLTQQQATMLLALPDRTSLSGKRDLAVLALMIGCGLRREEVSMLEWELHLVRINNRLHILNLLGKHDRTRTIRIPVWVERILNDWQEASGLTTGYVVRSFTPQGALNGSLSDSGVWLIVDAYAIKLGQGHLAPHDLRRTFAKLTRKGGASLESIQHTLGHASLTTTEKYVNSGEEADAGDYLEL